MLDIDTYLMYYLSMVSIILSKKVNGKPYCLRYMARIDGKPKRAWEDDFGSAENIEAAMKGVTLRAH